MVSVIIPYNKDRGYLNAAIESVGSQVYKDYELILEESDSIFSVNINNGIRKARGEFIKMLAEDDELTPNCLSILVKAIKGYDFVYADAQNFGDINGWGQFSHDHTTSFEEMLVGNRIHGGTCLYRKSALEEVGLYDEKLWTAEEYDLHMKLLKAGYKHRHIPAVVYRYRLHGNNKSLGNRVMRQELIKQIRKRYV